MHQNNSKGTIRLQLPLDLLDPIGTVKIASDQEDSRKDQVSGCTNPSPLQSLSNKLINRDIDYNNQKGKSINPGELGQLDLGKESVLGVAQKLPWKS